jgi:hypothetical protein
MLGAKKLEIRAFGTTPTRHRDSMVHMEANVGRVALAPGALPRNLPQKLEVLFIGNWGAIVFGLLNLHPIK